VNIIEHAKPCEGVFLPYQRRWIIDGSRMKIMEKARQVGMSWAAAYRAVRTAGLAGARHDVWVASRDEVQGRLFIEDCSRWARVLDVAAGDFGESLADGAGADCIRLANGRAVRSLSSSVDSQAGKRGTRILDEFALHADPRRLYAIAAPGLAWGGQLEILSTHRGGGNYFNQLVREAREGGNPKGFSLHRVTLQDAVEQGLLAKLKARLAPEDERRGMSDDEYLQSVRDSCPDEETWLEEYCCVPADDAAAFIPLDLIRRAEYVPGEGGEGQPWDMPMAELRKRREGLFLGVDLGRDRDLTVMWLLEMAGGTALTRKVVCMERTPFSAQEERLCELLSLPGLGRCAIDATGLGRQFAERAAQSFGERRVEGVILTAPLKEELAYPLKAAFEDGTIRIPPLDAVRADLRSVRRECGAGGVVRFTAGRGANGHADRFWALALALRAARAGAATAQAHAERISFGRERMVF
jgi:phage FluMu gp28-like protein